MTSEYLLVPEALGDLREIWSYISRDNLAAADRVEEHIRLGCEFIAQHPMLGNLRPDITALPVRFWTLTRFPNYILVYDPASSPLRIIRIFHGAMDLPRRL